jgi:hypothetical protein
MDMKMFENSEVHRLTKIDDIKKFMLAGKAIFTLESKRTGKWFTYQIKKKIFKNVINGVDVEHTLYFVSVLTGPENESSYTYLGTISPEFFLKTTKKSKISSTATSFHALNFFTTYLRYQQLHKEVNFYHEGRCGKCGKPLTTPTSVELGLGPICRGYDKPLTGSKLRKKKLQMLNRKLVNM